MNITIDLKIFLLLILGVVAASGLALLVAYGIMSHEDDYLTSLTKSKTANDCLISGAIMFPTGFIGSLIVLKD